MNKKPFKDINQSDTAKRKLSNIAKNNRLPLAFVTILYNYNWDLDTDGRESIGWVASDQYTEKDLLEGRARILAFLGKKEAPHLKKEHIVEEFIATYKEVEQQALETKLLIAGETKNNAYLSEYATFHYLTHLSAEKLIPLAPKGAYKPNDLIKYLFLKVFRGGGIERANLFYCYTDLCIRLPYEQKEIPIKNNWIATLLQKISVEKPQTLSDLLNSCKGILRGDKFFKQRVLQALSYAGKLKVNDIDVAKIYLPEFRDTLASHFYSNEWTYPLRMWNERNK